MTNIPVAKHPVYRALASLLPPRRVTLGVTVLLLVGLFTLAPVLYVVVESFDVATLGKPFTFGLDGWREILGNAKTWSSIVYSFILVLRVPVAIVIAFAISWLLIRVDLPGRRLIEMILWFGFFLPSVPMTMGWILLLDEHYGLVNALLRMLPFVHGPVFSIHSVTGIMWVHLSLTTVPIMVILLTPALRQLDSAYEEAAEISGAGVLTTLWRVTIPLLAPAILTAFLASLIRSLETFEVEQILGTPANIYVYATRMFDLINWSPPLFPQAMALASLFLVLLLLMALLYQAYLHRAGHRPTLTGKGVRFEPRPRTVWVRIAAVLLFTYVSVSILLPLAVLILGSFTKLFGFFFLDDAWTATNWTAVLGDDRFLRSTFTSVALSIAVGGLGTMAFAVLAWLLVRADIWGRGVIGVLVWLPWAIPGLVLGLTLLSLLLNTPLISGLYGTIVPLIVALIVKELPIGVQLLRASLTQVSGELEEAASVAGARFWATFRRVTLPLIAPMLISVFVLIFAATMRDISTVVLIATPGTRTLSLLMFDFALSGRFESAAVIGVLIAMISLAMTTIAFKLGMGNGANAR